MKVDVRAPRYGLGGGGGVSRLGEKRVIGKIQKITISEFTREAGLSTLEAYG